MLNTRITGTRYKATVPDTLDLADRAGLAINGLGGNIDPELMTMYGIIRLACERPHFSHWASAETLCDPKFAESFPLMRIMCGSDQYADLEAEFRKSLLSRIDDGLYWDRLNPKRPWRNSYAPAFYGSGKDEDFATLPGGGRMLRALLAWRDLGASGCEDVLTDLTAGLRRIAVCKDDYCYYPEHGGWGEPCAYPRSGWLNTDEAMGETDGGEGAVTCMHGHQLYGAARWYEESGDPVALDLAARLTRYCMLPRFWGSVPDPEGDRSKLAWHVMPCKPDPAFTAGSELGHWYSHFHARAITLRALLEYGRVTEDHRVLEFVRRAYEFTLSQGIPRMGWINCYPGVLNQMEGCAVGDLTALGIRLSDMGLGDYWDDVDSVVRNQLVEAQLVRADHLERIAEESRGVTLPEEANPAPGQLCYDNIIARSIGTFAGTSFPTHVADPWVMHCCTGNATQGLYYAWEGIVREDGDSAQVNLLLNRAGSLVDIDSYLPYEGRAVIHSKGARRISVRIPVWARSGLRVRVNDVDRSLSWVGNYVVADEIKPGDALDLTFPVPSITASYTVNAHSDAEKVYTCKFRGSTLVDISPRDDAPKCYPLYERQSMVDARTAPMREVERFVADRVYRRW